MIPTFLLAAFALAAPVPKAASSDLKWRFTKGDVFYVKYEEEKTSGGAQGVTAKGVAVWKWTVQSVSEKEVVLEQEYVSAKAGTGVGGAAITLTEDKGVPGKKVTITLDAKHQITKLDTSALRQGVGVADSFVSERQMRLQLAGLFQVIPGKALVQGEKWNDETENPFRAGLVAKRTNRGTVDEIANGVAKLSVESDHKWTGNTAGPPGLGANYNLKGEKGISTICFDTKTGRLQKFEDAYTVSGAVTITGQADQILTMTMSLKATATVSDKQPKDE